MTRRNRRGRKTTNKKIRQQIGKKSKAVHRRRHRQTRYRGMLGGGVTGDISDTNTFATYYIVKSATNKDNIPLKYLIQNGETGKSVEPSRVIQENFVPGNIPNGSVLWVIDMQNDFLDLIDTFTFPPGNKLTGPHIPDGKGGVLGNIGAFAVTDGNQIVKRMIDFIKGYGSKFKKIIFTRDFHPPAHCSFGATGGRFPSHCVYDTLGADITPEIKKLITFNGSKFKFGNLSTEIEILFKGHHTNGDSFGAVKYPGETEGADPADVTYLNTRQNRKINMNETTASCCQGAQCNGKTGGVRLQPGHYQKSNEQIVFGNGDTDQAKFLEKTYDIESTQPGPGGEVYVIGLAGEFCVKDTAINLKKYFGESVKVNVIQDLTRYVFVPIFLSFQRYDKDGKIIPFGEWKNPIDEKKLNTEVFKNQLFKPLSLYLFEYGGADPTNTKLLPAPEGGQIKDGNGDFITPDTDISFDPKVEIEQNGTKYWHFTMNQNELIKDYYNNDIKLCISESKADITKSNV